MLLNALIQRVQSRDEDLPGLACFYGPSGYGKTKAAVWNAQEYDCYWVEVKSTWTVKKLMMAIAKAMRLPHGGTAGDMIEMIAEELGNLGNIYRTDGTEFIVLASRCTVSEAKTQVLALLARFEASNFGTLEKPVCLTASAGIAEVSAATTFTQAFAAADAALESAKAAGRSRVCLASEPASPGIVEGEEVVWSSDLPPLPKRARARRS